MSINVFKAKYEVDECLEEIRKCLDIGWTGMGFKTSEFENAWKEYTGLKNAYFVNSSTAGLYLAVNILKEENGWKDDDEIITTPITFISTNHAILKSNMVPVFADVDDTMCLNPDSVRQRISEKTKAIMYVGIGGNAGNYKEIVEICRERNIVLILDAAHMAGTRLNGVIPGKEADVVIYSFQAVKNLPTADSGMLCFKNPKFDAIARKKGWLGISQDTYERTSNKGHYKWKYDVEYIGDKYHGNSVVAAIGLVQLKYLDRDNEKRREIVNFYKRYLQPVEDRLKYVRIEENCESSFHLFQIVVNKRDEMVTYLNGKEIYPGVHYASNINYTMYNSAKGTCPYSDYISEHVLSLPLHLHLTNNDIEYVSLCVREFLER